MKLMKFISRLILFAAMLSASAFAQDLEALKNAANEKIVRIKPSDYFLSAHCPKMPEQIVRHLEAQGCTIPQSYLTKNHHNAFEGQFLRRGQSDWAVLCSRDKTSSILLFPNGTTDAVQEIASMPDRDFIQSIDENGSLGFVRYISKTNGQRLAERYSASEPISFDHYGIDTITINREIIVYYFINDKFVVLNHLLKNL